MTDKNQYCPDIIVVGGGPAGIMAAGRAAELGSKVLIIEKTYRIGSKLLLTGGGRCNITNNADTKDFVAAFGADGKGRFLYRALSVFSSRDLISFFALRGLQMRVDDDNKVFPANDSADSVLIVLRGWLEQHNVSILHNTAVTGVVMSQDNSAAEGVKLANGEIIRAKKTVIATGGLSYPKTGSTGDGYVFAEKCGHKIAPLRPGLVSLESDDVFIKELQGVTLLDVLINLVIEGKKRCARRGDLLFTHYGVSGPEVLILSSSAVDDLAENKKVELSLNFMPQQKPDEIENALQSHWSSYGGKYFKNYLGDIFPESFAAVFERRCGVDGYLKCSIINREERKRIAEQFAGFGINITKPRPVEEATITRGGILLDEINPKTMESKLVKNLYFCGEVIDLDGITGGYNLQEAFSTGYLAGESAK